MPTGSLQETGDAVGRLGDAEQDLDERGLAGAVLAEQAEDFAALDGQRHAPQRLDAAVVLDEVVGDDDGHGSILWARIPISRRLEAV